MSDAKKIIEAINDRYEGVFGKFTMDEENDDQFSTALHPIPGNRHTEGSRITVSVEENVDAEYENRVRFVDEKTRPGMMGKPVDVVTRFGFDKEHGRLNNYSMMGVNGGYVFFTATKGNVLFCAELHVQKRHMTDEDLSGFLRVVLESI